MKTRLRSTKRVLLFAICFAAIAIFTVPALFLCEIVEREPFFAVGLTVGLTAVPAGFLVLLFAQPGKPDTGWFLWLIGIHVFFFGSCLAFGWLVYVTGLAVAAEPGWTAGLTVFSLFATIVMYRRSRSLELRGSLTFATSVLTGTWLCIGYVMLRWMTDDSFLPIAIAAAVTFIGCGLIVWNLDLRRRYSVLALVVFVPTMVIAINVWHATVRIPSATVAILKRIGPSSIPSLTRVLERRDHHDVEALESAVIAIGEFGPEAKQAAPAIVQLAHYEWDNGKFVASETIARALVRIEADREHLIAFFDEGGEVYSITKLQAEGEPFVPILEAFVRDPNKPARYSENGHRDRQLLCLQTLRKIGPSAVPALIRILSDWEAGFQDDAAEALAENGPAAKAAVPALMQLLTNRYASNRRAAEHAILSIAFGKSNPRTEQAQKAIGEFVRKPVAANLKKLLPILNDVHPNAGRHLAAGLKRNLHSKRGWSSRSENYIHTAEMLAILAPADEKTAQVIVGIVDDVENPKAVVITLRKMASDNKTAKMALKLLAANRYEKLKAIDPLRPNGYDFANLKLLGQIGPHAKIAFPLLVDWGGRAFYKGIHRNLADAAGYAAAAMDAPDFRLIKAAMNETQSKHWENALVLSTSSAFRSQRKTLIPILITLLQNPDAKVRETVIRAGLYQLAPFRRSGSLSMTDGQLRIALPILIDALDDGVSSSKRPAVNRFAVLVLYSLGKPAIPKLIAALKPDTKLTTTAQLGVIQVLERLRTDAVDALPALQNLSNGPNEELKKAAMKAIATIKPSRTTKP